MRRPLTCLTTLAALFVSAPLMAAPSLADSLGVDAPSAAASSTCLWFGPTFTADDTDLNYAFPDSGAGYWAAHFTIPTGATLRLEGEFAHARYQSLNAYDKVTKAPIDAVNDVNTQPDAGSVNPYLPHAKRDSKGPRSYSVTVSPDAPPADGGATNTLYAGVPGQPGQLVLYRLYLPDHGAGATGGVALPHPVLTLADGTVLRDDAACAALSSELKTPQVQLVAPASYAALRNQAGKPATFPAEDPVSWHAFYNPAFFFACTYLHRCTNTPARTGGQYSNVDNNYVSAFINRGFGEVLTLRGRLPRTPATLDGAHRMDRKVDMRYWSLCTNESSATTRVEACVFDEQVSTDKDGWYTIVVSRPGDRPANAIDGCGVTWVEWPERGDGAGHLDDGQLILRNMLPNRDFTHAVQNTAVAGDEREVMGDYLPTSSYGTRDAFEARGC